LGKAKKVGTGIGVAIAAVFIFSIILEASFDSTETELKNPKLTSAEIKSQALRNISYDDLLRNNQDYVGDIVYYQGEVLQIQNVYGDTYILRIGVTKDMFFYDDPIWVNYAGSRVLQDDIVDVWGEVKGIMQYEAVLGNQVEIPEINAMLVEVVKKQD